MQLETPSVSAAHSQETSTSETTGQRRTESYYARNLRLQNERRNPIRRIKEKIAGGRRAFYALTPAERETIHETAKTLYDLGTDFSVAQKAEATEHRGFVYVIDHPLMRGVKIGRAFNPESRLRGYQTGCPLRSYRLRFAEYFEDCHTAEAAIHARLNDHQLEGEWFAIAPDEAQEAIEAYGRNV